MDSRFGECSEPIPFLVDAEADLVFIPSHILRDTDLRLITDSTY